MPKVEIKGEEWFKEKWQDIANLLEEKEELKDWTIQIMSAAPYDDMETNLQGNSIDTYEKICYTIVSKITLHKRDYNKIVNELMEDIRNMENAI